MYCILYILCCPGFSCKVYVLVQCTLYSDCQDGGNFSSSLQFFYLRFPARTLFLGHRDGEGPLIFISRRPEIDSNVRSGWPIQFIDLLYFFWSGPTFPKLNTLVLKQNLKGFSRNKPMLIVQQSWHPLCHN